VILRIHSTLFKHNANPMKTPRRVYKGLNAIASQLLEGVLP